MYRLGVRQGAKSSYPIAGKLSYGERVLVKGTKNEGEDEWLRLADERGFIKGEFTKRS